MKKTIIAIAALTILSLAAASHTALADDTIGSNAVNISESFDTASPTGVEEYTGGGDGYRWSVLATRDFGYASGNTYRAIPEANKTAVSLTANSDNNGVKRAILTIADGTGGEDKDVDITLDAGVCAVFSQTAKTWELVFSSSDGTELFSLEFRNGDNAIVAALEADGVTQDTDYEFTANSFTNVKATVSFNSGGGGRITFGNVSADFEAGTDIAEMAVRSSSTSDQNRPFVIDNFTMKTVDNTRIFFDITSSGNGQSVRGAELSVDGNTYTIGEDGVFSKYFRQNTSYNYGIRLANHEQYTGSFTAYTADKYIDTYTFKNVEARRPTLIHAYYDEKNGALEEVSVEEVRVDNTYTVQGERRHGSTEKYFLWNSVKGMTPYAAATLKKGETDNFKINLQYHASVIPDRIELTGGSDYIYIPKEGYINSSPISAVVYDDLGYVMKNAVLVWSLPEETEHIGIIDGVVTIGDSYDFTGETHNVKIRATVMGTDVHADKTLAVRKVSDIDSFTVAGPVVIKNGTAAQYTVGSITDKYGKESDEIPEFTLAAFDETGTTELALDKADINGLVITPTLDMDGSREKKIKLVISLEGIDKKVEKNVTVYDYDFYEPGVGTASYGSPRMEEVNGEVSIVWPATESAGRTTSIPLPKPVELAPGSCKVITFDNFATVDTVSSQERSLRITNSDGVDIINLDYKSKTIPVNGKNTHYVNVLNSLSQAEDKSVGEFALNTKSSAKLTLKTDAQGITTVSFAFDDNDIAEDQVAGMVYDIAEIRMRGATAAPNVRLLSLTNIKIDNGILSGVEITGSDKLAIVNGADAKKQFGVKIFSLEENESFEWSVTDKDGDEIDGVSIADGMLNVSDSVKTLIDKSSLSDSESGSKYIEAVIKYTGSKGSGAQKTIKILDYSGVSDFTLTGPEYLAAGTSTASYYVSDITDTYGNEADMQKAYMITTGEDIASIDMETGEVTINEGKTGTFTVTAAVGNPGKTKLVDLPVTIAKYAETGDAEEGGVEVDVTKLANYSANTKYLVTTATEDKKLVNQTEQTAENGIVTVDTTGADKYEVSPIYSFTEVGDVSAGKTIPVCNGVYDFTFKKSNTTRADIFVNGAMVGQNVDQVSIQRTLSEGSEYTARDIKVEDGKAVVVMKDNTSAMDSITVRKTPSILDRKTHVYVLGDSLASAYYGAFDSVDEEGVPLAGTGQTGWGETLDYFFTDDLIVTNLAESGSAAAALYATTFEGVIQNGEAGDYLIMECGYQDAPNSTREMMLSAVENIYNACRDKGIELILVTPNCAAHGTANIEAISRDGGVRFGPALMDFAASKGILGVDLSGAGTENNEYTMLIEYGEDYWLSNFNLVRPEDGVAVDRLHSSYWGAVMHSANIATVISEAQKELDEDGDPTPLAARLAGLHLDDQAEYVMKDTNGDTKKFKIGWRSEVKQDEPQPE